MDNLEETRFIHEERDRLEHAFAQEMLSLNSANYRDRIDKEHKLRGYLDQHVDYSKKLRSIYNHRIGQRRELSQDPFEEFYNELNKILDKNLDVAISLPEEDDETEIELKSKVFFTDEEGYGKYLDLNTAHLEFCQMIRIDYITYLKEFDNLKTKLDSKIRISSAYIKYLEIVINYFRDFGRRTKPLVDWKSLEDEACKEFIDDWMKERIDLNNLDSWEELLSLGLDKLKDELQERGLKCGGTLEQRAKRLWQVRGKSPNDIDTSLQPTGKDKNKLNPINIGSMEYILALYSEYFHEHRLSTIENVQRKQSRTAEERNESDEDLSDIEFDDNDDSEAVYNPKNLPLGWDGKPIPYWLYKLHGLNLSFTCEICGNAVYKGPKTFQRHFAEWRHAQGMNALGIPNTAHFANVTKIQDAIILWDKLKVERERNKFQASVEEEFEDSQGNVVNKKTYEDLKRQGLL